GHPSGTVSQWRPPPRRVALAAMYQFAAVDHIDKAGKNCPPQEMRLSLLCYSSSFKTCMRWPWSSEANFALAQSPAKWHTPLLPKPEARSLSSDTLYSPCLIKAVWKNEGSV